MSARGSDRHLQVEAPERKAIVDFLDVNGKNGFLVTITRRDDDGISLHVRQTGPASSSVYHETEFELDPFIMEGFEHHGMCTLCGEFAEVNVDAVCENCEEQADPVDDDDDDADDDDEGGDDDR